MLAESDRSAEVYGLTEIQARNAKVGTLVRLPREPLSAYAEIINDDGDSIRVFAKPRTTRKPAASNTDIQIAADSITKFRETVNVYNPITYSLIAPGTSLVDGKKARKDNNVLGYSYPGGGAFILPNRHINPTNNSDAEYDPETSWNSVSLKTYSDRLTHSSYHEMSHSLAHKTWGVNDYDNGEKELQKDYDKFGVTGQAVSQYGKDDVGEHFAEALARYITTGDATPEFMAVLRSKELLKSQEGESETQITRTPNSTSGDSNIAPNVNKLSKEPPPKFDDDKFYDVTISPRFFEELKELDSYILEDGFIFKPGKYTLSGDRASSIFIQYQSYLEDFDAASDMPGLVTAARVGAKSLRESSKSPKEATAERAPNKTKKNRIKEVKDLLLNLSVELFHENEDSRGRLLSREEVQNQAKRDFSDLKAKVESGLDSDDTRRTKERRARVERGEQAYVDMRLGAYDDYLELTKQLKDLTAPNTIPDVSELDAPSIKFLKSPRKPYSPKAAVSSSKDAKEKVLSSLLDKVKDGKAPWRKPFKDGFNFAGAFVPRNPASKRVYSGLNSLVLKLHQQLEGYEDPRWMTYNQAQSMGGQVRKGEKGTPILVPFKRVKKEKDSTTGEEKVTGGYVSFSAKTVFNVAQIDGLDLPDLKTEAGEPKTPLEAQDFIIERYKKSMEAKGLKAPEINYTYVGEYGSHDSSPNWRPSSDSITLPTKEQFNTPETMFDTMAHELAHSTGHPTRLDRSELTKNYSTDNASRGKEELIAEISAAILASMFGVNSDLDNTAAYVKSWLKALQDNPEMIIGASSDAQKVVDYLLGMDIGDWSPIEGYSTAAKSDKEED